jgi:hypothetical protein
MKLSSILAVILLVASVSSASLSMTVSVSAPVNLGTLTGDASGATYYGVTVHFISSGDATMKPAVYNLSFTGSMFQMKGSRGYAGGVTFWADQLAAELVDGGTEEAPTGAIGASLTALEAVWDTHICLNSFNQPTKVFDPYTEGTPGLLTPAQAIQFGDTLDASDNSRARGGVTNFIGGTFTTTNPNKYFLFASDPVTRLVDTPFIYLVLQGTKTVSMSGTVTFNDGGGINFENMAWSPPPHT